MNERIKELREQALTMVSDEQQDHGESYEIRELWDRHDQKFAELIVQECMRMCEVAQVGYLTHGLEKEASGAYSAKQYIEEHFGIES